MSRRAECCCCTQSSCCGLNACAGTPLGSRVGLAVGDGENASPLGAHGRIGWAAVKWTELPIGERTYVGETTRHEPQLQDMPVVIGYAGSTRPWCGKASCQRENGLCGPWQPPFVHRTLIAARGPWAHGARPQAVALGDVRRGTTGGPIRAEADRRSAGHYTPPQHSRAG